MRVDQSNKLTKIIVIFLTRIIHRSSDQRARASASKWSRQGVTGGSGSGRGRTPENGLK